MIVNICLYDSQLCIFGDLIVYLVRRTDKSQLSPFGVVLIILVAIFMVHL